MKRKIFVQGYIVNLCVSSGSALEWGQKEECPVNSDKKFFKTVCQLAIPVTLQSMLQSSFSIVDQIMIGQLGTIPVAGVGFAGKFSSIFTVVVSAVGAVAGIMISQYVGQKNGREVRRSFLVNLWLALAVAGIFTALCLCFPQWLMGLYTGEVATREAAVDYLQIIAGTFLPLAGATLLSTLYRCTDRPQIPLYASLASALLNTGLNYVLIFGKLGFAPMGARGAALATVASQCANLVLMLLLMPRHKTILPGRSCAGKLRERMNWRQYLAILLPILACEMLWSLGENVYAGIYGHIGTEASAAMVLTNPIQGLMIGALCGLSQAAGVIVGKSLGNAEYDEAYMASKKMLRYGFVGACLLSVIICCSGDCMCRFIGSSRRFGH